ncbi:DUF7402 domain-containing protein [Loigolactobacillus coryniformis]|uniref:DUF7402 domain-containing protein n=1 Tax=Loigolactobacillus coryniformis TaxID=1610 RepID=UPI001C5CDD0E|nr:hypothetical protein [Loigolactobacillus coryniformis]MBW4803743.1 hypothetical protein [Loigolactobacillus coryniformis subsp. torquens]MBW4806450.1 hypothetical protein [Loigolactobacillus coryniformis subsp. torquens]
MKMLKIQILDQAGQVRQGKNDYEEFQRPLEHSGVDFCYLATQDLQYLDQDVIRVTTDRPNQYLLVKLDETMDTSLIYVPGKQWEYHIDLSQNAVDARPDKAFTSKRHYLSVRRATMAERNAYRNLALNPHDQKESTGAYPHASANVETRNDATFFACNAIDGVLASNMHGEYPYQSWGINQQADAALTIDFGRPVTLDQAALVLRADFPHDSYWSQVALHFSDGSVEVVQLEKSGEPQYFQFAKRTVTQVTVTDLKKATDDSPFPALDEIELYGVNVE